MAKATPLSLRLSFLLVIIRSLMKSVRRWTKWVLKNGAQNGLKLKEIETKDRMALHDGDTKGDYEGYAGNYFISARNKTRPTIFDRDGKTPLVQADGKPYAGCYVNAAIELWCQDNNYGKRINASLRGVQFLKDGEAFAGGGVASEDDFEDLSADEEGADPLFA